MKKKILIVKADYYKDISKGLERSAISLLSKEYMFKIISVPGVFEIPVTISKNLKKFHGFIALGCVIKGKTPHFDFISLSTTEAIMRLSVESTRFPEYSLKVEGGGRPSVEPRQVRVVVEPEDACVIHQICARAVDECRERWNRDSCAYHRVPFI